MLNFGLCLLVFVYAVFWPTMYLETSSECSYQITVHWY